MRLLRFIPIQLTLILILGILLGNSFNFGIAVPLVSTIVLLAVSAVIFYRGTNRKTLLFAITAALLTLSVGILIISLSNPLNRSSHYSNSSVEGNQTIRLKIKEVLKPTSFSNRYIADIKSVNNQSTTGKVLLSFPADSLLEPLPIDEELILYGSWDEISSPLNPHQFDYKSYLSGLNIAHQIRAKNDDFITIKGSRTIYGRAVTLRQHIISRLQKANFEEAELSIIQALLLGQRNDISAATYNDYKNAGAVHILAVSGLHIGILLILLQFLLKPLELLPNGKTIKLILIVILLWAFALLAGFSASIVRAVTMFSFVAYALYLNRPSNTFNILALSMFFILLVINPKLLFHVGFQMSYAAVFAIVWIYPLLQRLWYPKHIAIRKIWQLLSVSIAAQLGVLPISLFYFHQFPGLFFISNLLIVPALGIILGMGILIIMLALGNCLPDFMVTLYDTLIWWMNTIIKWVAEQEAFVFQNISFDAIQLILAYAILIALITFLTKPNFKKGLVLATGIIGFQAYLYYTAYQTKKQEQLLVLHQTTNSVLLHQSGTSLNVYCQDSTKTQRIVTDYQIGERTTSVTYNSILNSYIWKNKSLLILDSTGVYPTAQKEVDYLLLTQSPKINLERVIDSLQPKQIIADGSNYRSYRNRWQRTCAKRKLPFHYTGEKGSFVLFQK